MKTTDMESNVAKGRVPRWEERACERLGGFAGRVEKHEARKADGRVGTAGGQLARTGVGSAGIAGRGWKDQLKATRKRVQVSNPTLNLT